MIAIIILLYFLGACEDLMMYKGIIPHSFADVNAAWQAFDNQFGIVRQELSLPEELPNEDEGNEEEIIPNEDQIPETPVTDENVTE